MYRQIKFALIVVLAVSGAVARGAILIESEPNDSIPTAQNIDPYFTLDYSPDIGDTTTNTSTVIPHVTIVGTGNGTTDYYYFSAGAGARGIFEIDYGMPDLDPVIYLTDSVGGALASNDDSVTTYGQGGSIHPYDSYIEYIFTTPGVYKIQVTSYSFYDLPGGTDYQLQVSIQDHALASVPEAGSLTVWAALFCTVAGAIAIVPKRKFFKLV